jgi:hypothetical protein
VAGEYGSEPEKLLRGDTTAGELTVALRKSVYAVGGVIGVLSASPESGVLRASKFPPIIGVRGSSEGSGEKGTLGWLARMTGWPEVLRGAGRAGGMTVKLKELVVEVGNEVMTVIGGTVSGGDDEALW